jgi:hypothetical protein
VDSAARQRVVEASRQLKLEVQHVEYLRVQPALAAVTKTIDGRGVVVAIIGGTMLTLALTRPQLRWMANMPRSGKSQRLWAERALTGFSFVMIGYAGTAVWLVLHRQLDSQTDALLRGAAYFFLVYAGLVHFEPFVNEWRLRTGIGTFVLYATLMVWAMLVGTIVAEYSLTSNVHLATDPLTLEVTAAVGLSWLFCRASTRLGAAFDRRLDSGAEALARRLGLKRVERASAAMPGINKAECGSWPGAPFGPSSTSSCTPSCGPTRTPARSTRA